MYVLPTTTGLERDYLRALYELADKRAKNAVSHLEVRSELGRSDDEAERACDFWADRGIVEWASFGHVALTHLGLRRAERLAVKGWSHTPF